MKKRHESWCTNFLLRFFYEFFLEFCIVIMINLSVRDFSEFSPSFSYMSAILILLVIVFVFALLICHFCCYGPYVSGYYMRGTLLQSLWGPRPINPEFDTEAYLKANKRNGKH